MRVKIKAVVRMLATCRRSMCVKCGTWYETDVEAAACFNSHY